VPGEARPVPAVALSLECPALHMSRVTGVPSLQIRSPPLFPSAHR
jgi:hypothetical protein